MGVQGFPTLKTVKPGPKPGMPIVEDYQGPRNAKGIVDAVVDKIPNHVKKLQDKGLEQWLAAGNDTLKAILFTEKGTTSALLRALAIDYLGVISVAQIRNKETTALEMFGISSFPKLVLLPGGAQEPLLYDGEMKKDHMVKFLSQFAAPNPDPAPKSSKSQSSKSKAAQPSSSATSGKSASRKPTETDGTVILDEEPISKPAETVAVTPEPLPTLATAEELQIKCLGPKTGTCLLVLLPSISSVDGALPERTEQALKSLETLANKNVKANAKLFPFYAVPAENGVASKLRASLDLKPESDLEIIVLNAKKLWWRRFGDDETGAARIESFINNIKLGDGKKDVLPEALIDQKVDDASEHDEL
jgi:protein disulfide-isomerase A6